MFNYQGLGLFFFFFPTNWLLLTFCFTYMEKLTGKVGTSFPVRLLRLFLVKPKKFLKITLWLCCWPEDTCADGFLELCVPHVIPASGYPGQGRGLPVPFPQAASHLNKLQLHSGEMLQTWNAIQCWDYQNIILKNKEVLSVEPNA